MKTAASAYGALAHDQVVPPPTVSIARGIYFPVRTASNHQDIRQDLIQRFIYCHHEVIALIFQSSAAQYDIDMEPTRDWPPEADEADACLPMSDAEMDIITAPIYINIHRYCVSSDFCEFGGLFIYFLSRIANRCAV